MKNKIKFYSIVSILIIALFSSYGFKAKVNASRVVVHVATDNKCRYCNGSGNCSTCLGAKKIICSRCKGKGSGNEAQLNNGYGDHDIPYNTYTGTPAHIAPILQCPDCNGKGKLDCRACNGSGVCSHCKGTGKSPN